MARRDTFSYSASKRVEYAMRVDLDCEREALSPLVVAPRDAFSSCCSAWVNLDFYAFVGTRKNCFNEVLVVFVHIYSCVFLPLLKNGGCAFDRCMSHVCLALLKMRIMSCYVGAGYGAPTAFETDLRYLQPQPRL